MSAVLDAALFPDQMIERRVDDAIARGAKLARWGWPLPGPYNGATGAERIAVWQKLDLAFRNGWLIRPGRCSICPRTSHLASHQEVYARGFYAFPVCRSCHYRLHSRFRDPAKWQALLEAHPASWAATLSLIELTREQSFALARLRHPLPNITDQSRWRGA